MRRCASRAGTFAVVARLRAARPAPSPPPPAAPLAAAARRIARMAAPPAAAAVPAAALEAPARPAAPAAAEDGKKAPKAHRGLTSLSVGGFDLDAVSIGGQETCICVPSLKLAFDIGRCPQRAVHAEHLFLSHCHLDHVGGAGNYAATRAMLGLPPPAVFVPAASAAALERYFAALRELDGSEIAARVTPVAPGDDVALRDGRHVVRPFATTHPVASQGYCVYSRRSKLRAQYAGLEGAAVAALRRGGTAVSDVVETPVLAFTGDTGADWLARRHEGGVTQDALRAKLLIVECTFVDDAVTPADARSWGHTHLDELIAQADAFENEAILLIHFSARYRRADILAALAAKLPPSLAGRVTPLLEGYS